MVADGIRSAQWRWRVECVPYRARAMDLNSSTDSIECDDELSTANRTAPILNLRRQMWSSTNGDDANVCLTPVDSNGEEKQESIGKICSLNSMRSRRTASRDLIHLDAFLFMFIVSMGGMFPSLISRRMSMSAEGSERTERMMIGLTNPSGRSRRVRLFGRLFSDSAKR